jgi:HAMP domain-containing protein
MNKLSFLGVLATLLVATGVQAQNPDSRRAEAEKLFEKANQAKAEGRGEEAEKLSIQAKKLQGEVGDRDDADREQVRRLKREIKELRHGGKRNEAGRLDREHGGRRDQASRPLPPGEPGERLRHVQEAIAHLRAAGLEEPADHLEQEARKIRGAVEQAHRNMGGRPPEPQELQAAMREMRENMQAMRGELQKMAQVVNELREQMKRERGDSGKGSP